MSLNKPTILVTGGAGYIGSVIAHQLVAAGYAVVIVDLQAVPHALIPAIHGDIRDHVLMERVAREYAPQGIVHCAAYIEVGESVQDPIRYYDNNVAGTIALLDWARAHGIQALVFSSSCAVYGTPQYVPIDEKHPRAPISPYGRTKNMVEQILLDADRAYAIRHVALRYFNAAGALPEFGLGERHDPETHLIPNAITAAYTQKPFLLFGTDHATPDGTCVRDFVHVADLADAHVRAMDYLLGGGGSTACNLGTGKGYSVAEVLAAVEMETGVNIIRKEQARREGDPAILVADSSHAHTLLGWLPKRSDLKQIVMSAVQYKAMYCDSSSHHDMNDPACEHIKLGRARDNKKNFLHCCICTDDSSSSSAHISCNSCAMGAWKARAAHHSCTHL